MTQDQAFSILTFGKNVFLTGAAGSGKTHVLNRYITWLRSHGIDPAITASTGIAATHIGGQTIHSWSGIGIKDYLTEYDREHLLENEKVVKRARATSVLIIDEVSMLSGATLDAIDVALRTTRARDEPFGGLQVVLSGDFFQLPPVVTGGGVSSYAFESDAWRNLRLHMCYLTEQYRQSDVQFLGILNAIRTGTVTVHEHKLLEERIIGTPPETIPHLYTHNVDVDRLNQVRLDALPGKLHRFSMRTKGSKKRIEQLMKGLLVGETVQLKVGASVMFVKNAANGSYVNGTVGTVADVVGGTPVVRTLDGRLIEAAYDTWTMTEGDKVLAEIAQVPLRLAWAVTIHKSQGLTLDAAYLDLSRPFVAGQGYVALSRVRELGGVYLKAIGARAYERDERVAEYDERIQHESERLVARLDQTDATRIRELGDAHILASGGTRTPTHTAARSNKRRSTYVVTADLVRAHKQLSEIARERGMTSSTIVSHLEHLLQDRTFDRTELSYLMAECSADLIAALDSIRTVFEQDGTWKLAPVHQALHGRFSFDELRLARLFMRPLD